MMLECEVDSRSEAQKQWDAHKARQARIAAAAEKLKRDKEPKADAATATAVTALDEWVERQKQIPIDAHSGIKEPWFCIIDEIDRRRPPLRISDIINAAIKAFPGISKNDILSPRRTADVVRVRQISMYLAKEMTRKSLPEIGRCFGGRDHTTAIHAVKKIKAKIEIDEETAEIVNQLRRAIEEEFM
jgi:hypothetical protein